VRSSLRLYESHEQRGVNYPTIVLEMHLGDIIEYFRAVLTNQLSPGLIHHRSGTTGNRGVIFYRQLIDLTDELCPGQD